MKNDVWYDDFVSPSLSGDWHRIKTSSLPYFTLADVEKIYFVLNDCSSKGFKEFAENAKEIATFVPEHLHKFAFQFKDEVALFELFKKFLPHKLEVKGIDTWGRLMQYIS